MTDTIICYVCDGAGMKWIEGYWRYCPKCNGKGYIYVK